MLLLPLATWLSNDEVALRTGNIVFWGTDPPATGRYQSRVWRKPLLSDCMPTSYCYTVSHCSWLRCPSFSKSRTNSSWASPLNNRSPVQTTSRTATQRFELALRILYCQVVLIVLDSTQWVPSQWVYLCPVQWVIQKRKMLIRSLLLSLACGPCHCAVLFCS